MLLLRKALSHKEGVVLSDPTGDTVLVQAGIIKTSVKIDNLRLIDSNKKNKVTATAYTRNVKSKAVADFKTELDIRGMNIEEAFIELDKFIDGCLIASIPQARIIHGKGTGVLRNAVQTYLRKHKSVRTFRLGVYGEGESGVSIVEFK